MDDTDDNEEEEPKYYSMKHDYNNDEDTPVPSIQIDLRAQDTA
eukprot:CAMPEP_0194409828 /NCGR_PEP_ID=MMETSP0176-20130528/7760_1 /TAXON_ID=216777 /ORGANISM="Proboscia alata, Strain PI-D3" /LENGTH=42 /DNA_ID= /DNA_START= /DNA_END= /DNA_ORIENTATION=